MLRDNGVARLTYNFYDREIDKKKEPYIVFIIRDRFGGEENNRNSNFNTFNVLKSSSNLGVKVGWVDIYDDGELIKETLDAELFPCAFFISENMFYVLPIPPEGYWTNDELAFKIGNTKNLKGNY